MIIQTLMINQKKNHNIQDKYDKKCNPILQFDNLEKTYIITKVEDSVTDVLKFMVDYQVIEAEYKYLLSYHTTSKACLFSSFMWLIPKSLMLDDEKGKLYKKISEKYTTNFQTEDIHSLCMELCLNIDCDGYIYYEIDNILYAFLITKILSS